MARYKKLPPQVELRATGRILIRDNRKTHYKFIQPRRPQGVQRFSIKGKSSKYVINTVLPYYIEKVRTEGKRTRMYKELLVNLQTKCNKIIRDIRSTERKSLRQLIKLNTREYGLRLRAEAHKIANKNFNHTKCKLSMAYHGANALPVMLKYAEENNISPTAMGVLIILGYSDRMTASDFIKFGYVKRLWTYELLNILTERGLAEKFEEKTTGNQKHFSFMISLKGRRVIMNFNTFYTMHISKVIETDEYKQKHLRWRNL